MSQTPWVGVGCLCLWILHPPQRRAASPLVVGHPQPQHQWEGGELRKGVPHLAKLGLWQGSGWLSALPPSAVWQVIDALAQAISRMPGCVLLDVDAGASTNRTVYTFVGSPEAVIEGALSAARVAGQLIDMSRHTGELRGGAGSDLARNVPRLRCVVGSGCTLHGWSYNQLPVAKHGTLLHLQQAVLPGWMVVGPCKALAHPPDPERMNPSCPWAGVDITAANSTFLMAAVPSLQKRPGKGCHPSLSACSSQLPSL